MLLSFALTNKQLWGEFVHGFWSFCGRSYSGVLMLDRHSICLIMKDRRKGKVWGGILTVFECSDTALKPGSNSPGPEIFKTNADTYSFVSVYLLQASQSRLCLSRVVITSINNACFILIHFVYLLCHLLWHPEEAHDVFRKPSYQLAQQIGQIQIQSRHLYENRWSNTLMKINLLNNECSQ